jgi:glycosyltransferase involved in cell wall biosynthesis
MKPAVSCICVTQNRRFFLRRAVEYFWRSAGHFERATGLSAELVIVDGSKDPNPHIGPLLFGKVSDFHYAHEPSTEHARTGYFHNRAVELSQGDVIIQWDDDDWHSPHRIFQQYTTLLTSHEPAFAFTSKFYLYHLVDKVASLARTWYGGKKCGTVGAMFAYHRATWEKVPFQDVPQGEDNWFWEDCKKAAIPFLDSEDPTFCIYLRHHQNGSPLTHEKPAAQVTAMVRHLFESADDLAFYDELTELLPLENWNRLRAPNNPYVQRQIDRMMMLRRPR